MQLQDSIEERCVDCNAPAELFHFMTPLCLKCVERRDEERRVVLRDIGPAEQ